MKEKAAEAGVTPSSFLRQLAIHAHVKARLTEEQRQWVRKLIGMENNVNQIAKVCHQEGAIKGMVYFQGIRRDIDSILKKFRA
ncbi:plasmid mobilization protein [Puia sp. P3]|uniref:plasmid mobilization protein n=1 Tax=Puia sp. P3 TaxID=3423952 RepID=UPI003D6794D7